METGIFDIPAPLLTWADVALGHVLPDRARLVLWAVLAGTASMALYWLVSPQRKLESARRATAEARQALAAYDGAFDGIWPIMGRSLSTSFRHLGLALGPALVGSLPVLVLMGWMAGHYGYELPAAGEKVRVYGEPADRALVWPDGIRVDGEGPWTLSWPGADQAVRLTDASGQTMLTLPLSRPVPVIHKRAWWNMFFANPLGSLPENAPVDLIGVEMRTKIFLPFGPGWMRGWEAPFILAVLLASVTVKILFRIR
jgi:hypothetical protein